MSRTSTRRNATRGGGASSGHVCEQCKKKISKKSRKHIFLYDRQLPTDKEPVELYVCGRRCLDAWNHGPEAGYDQGDAGPALTRVA